MMGRQWREELPPEKRRSYSAAISNPPESVRHETAIKQPVGDDD